MNAMPRTINRTISFLAILLAVVSPAVASAATSTWTGGSLSGSTWSSQQNWGSSTLPTPSGTYSLQFSGTTRTNTINNNIGTISISSLSFTNDGGTGQNSFFQISSGTLAFNNSSIVTTTATAGVFTNNSDGDTISSAMTFSGTSTFTMGSLHNLSLSGNMSGSGAVVYAQTTPDTIDYAYISGINNYTGGTVIEGAAVNTGARTSSSSNSSAFGSGSVTIRNTGSMLVRNNSVITNNITASGTGQNGSAVIGSFGTAGSTAELQGRIQLASDVQFATASSAANDISSKLVVSGTIDLGANTLTLRSGVRSGQTDGLLIQVTGKVTGSGGVSINGAVGGSRVLMSGNNDYLGGTTISTGTLSVGSRTALGGGFLAITPSGTGVLDLNGQALEVGALSGNSTAVILSSTSGNASLMTTSSSNTTYAGTIRNSSGVVGLTKAGSGILTLSGSNSNTGQTNVNGGVLALGNANALAGGGTIAFGGGTLQYSGNNTQDYSSRIKTSGSSISIDTNGQNVTFAGVIDSSNTGGLKKSGAGTLLVNGVNTYTGNTVIETGTLGGNGTIAGLVTVGTNAFISPGNAANTTGVLSVGSLDMSPGGTAIMAISGTAASTYDQIVASSLVNFANGILNINFTQGGFQNYDFWQLFSGSPFSGDLSQVNLTGSYAGTFVNLGNGEWKADVGGGQSLSFYETNHLFHGVGLAGQLVLVPEPSTYIIAGIGIVVVGWQSLIRRRRLALLRQSLIANDQLAV